MQVTIRLHASLRRYLPAGTAGNAVRLDVPAGTTVAAAMDRLGVVRGHAKMMVSGAEQLEPGSVLREGQEVDLFPPLAGG